MLPAGWLPQLSRDPCIQLCRDLESGLNLGLIATVAAAVGSQHLLSFCQYMSIRQIDT